MADKLTVNDWSETPSDNDNIAGVPLSEGVTYPSHVNNAIRILMAQVKIFLAKFARVDIAQAFTNAEKLQARTNIGAVGKIVSVDRYLPLFTGTAGELAVSNIQQTAAGSFGIAATPSSTMNNGKALALGDGDTGIRQNGAGILEIVTNDFVTAIFGPGAMRSVAGNGWVKLPNGIIIQWGDGGYGASPTQGVITLPITFPNAILQQVATINGSTQFSLYSVITEYINNSSFRYTKYAEGNSNNFFTPAEGFRWIAIGY